MLNYMILADPSALHLKDKLEMKEAYVTAK